MPESNWKSKKEVPMWEGDEEFYQSLYLMNHDEEFSEEEKSEEKDQTSKNNTEFPLTLPILPLRGLVVYPQTAVPLTIGQPRSIRLVDDVVASDLRLIGLITSRNPELENPGPDDLFQIGTMAMIHRFLRAPDGTIRLLVQGIARFKLTQFIETEPYLKAEVKPVPEIIEAGIEIDALVRNAQDQFDHIAELIPSIPRELVASVTSISDPLQTAYTIANFQRMDLRDAQEILEIDTVSGKLHRLVNILTRESEVLDLGQKIQNEARSEIDRVQREYFLREQLKAIQKELGEADEHALDVEEFRQKIEEAGMPSEAEKQARRELERLSRLPTAASEYGVIRTYLDWLVSLPWGKVTQDNLDISHARQVLEEDHFGLEDVKERILEFLAVRKLRLERQRNHASSSPTDFIRREREGVILCLVGPPGVGKTSLGRSIARAMERKFIRLSLGGMRDEAEIRGHRRTYIGAMPGRILQALRRTESRNPVFMLDEIDKLTFDFHGDPASALLEVLDPEQNSEFRDNYLEVSFDLSLVMFITTANQVETIPPPLLDRMEVIRIAGYTENEKTEIARQYLVPRQIRENGLRPSEVDFSKEAILEVIRGYTREAGVRNLEREVGSICRKVATQLTEGKRKRFKVTPSGVRKFLGRRKFTGIEDIHQRIAVPGIATGLAWTPAGGEVLFIEATSMRGSKSFIITGSVGNVMQESAQAALSYIRSHSSNLGIDPEMFEKADIHLHIPAGAQPKDGPSAGVTIACALVSLLTNRMVRSDVAMTGEVTLRGQVLPVGGIKEKVLAAHRYGIHTVILPKANQSDLDDIPDEVQRELRFVFAKTINDVLNHAFEDSLTRSKKKKISGMKNEKNSLS